MAKTVLIVEDERAIVEILKFNLKREGYETLEALDGQTGLQLAQTKDPDLILLDVMLPKMNGFEVCKLLRDKGRSTPVLIITAREEEKDKILGLDLGADDYIAKPFSVREVLARVRSVLRRTAEVPAEQEPVAFEGLGMDLRRKVCTLDGKELALTKKEFEILALLLAHRGGGQDLQIQHIGIGHAAVIQLVVLADEGLAFISQFRCICHRESLPIV